MRRRGIRKCEVGVVVGDKMDKTITIRVERKVQHPIYKKYIKRYTTYKAHDEQNTCKVGDKVEIVETRPLSKTKRWNVKQIVQKAPEV
ncbi:MAG: 30S ribosomal protein S17 [Deltaproteobacteria bacterium RBG_16_54_18]|jgi:small subunit ribosomal protein S17|nr:MAG: 30S ribosomal protein S17 [Deltaproteobacteria bacterium RBG_16_54_18]